MGLLQMFNRFVDSRYALREELDEVREDVKIIKSDTVELKSVMNFIKWAVLATVPITAIATNVTQEVKDQFKQENTVQQQKQNQKDPQIIEIDGNRFLIFPNGSVKPISK